MVAIDGGSREGRQGFSGYDPSWRAGPGRVRPRATAGASPCVILARTREALATRSKIVRLFVELQRRKVFRIIAGYAVASFVIMQVAEIVVEALELSDGVLFWALTAVVGGLPIALALSWRYDLSPQGLKFTAALEDEDVSTGATGAGSPRGEGQPAAVAVLPFDNLTPNTPHAYLADAIPIELQSTLSRVHDLRVVSRQSAAARAVTRTDLRTIAKDLTVQYVISGSVADLGEQLQINVQLDDALDDKLLWSERYDVAAKDVERLQREISEKVVGTFGGERMRAEIDHANKTPNAEPTAWQLVQKARSYLLDYTPASIAASTPLLRRAIELDPKYAIAYATLGLVTAEKTLNALSSDPAADRKTAIETIARAERLAPRDPVVLRTAGCVHAYTGQYRRSIELLAARREARALRPRHLGLPRLAARRDGTSAGSSRAARDRRPSSRDLRSAPRTRVLDVPQVGRAHLRRRVRASARARRGIHGRAAALLARLDALRECARPCRSRRGCAARPWSSASRTTRS